MDTRLFQSERVVQLFLQIMFDYRQQGKFLIHEFVPMPNHFHMILTPASGVTLERSLQFIRGDARSPSLRALSWMQSRRG